MSRALFGGVFFLPRVSLKLSTKIEERHSLLEVTNTDESFVTSPARHSPVGYLSTRTPLGDTHPGAEDKLFRTNTTGSRFIQVNVGGSHVQG